MTDEAFDGGRTPDARGAVRHLMVRSVARISPDATLLDVAQKLGAIGAGVLVVGTNRHASSVISEVDITRAIGAGRDPAQLRAGDIAGVDDIVWCSPDDTLREATRKMAEAGVRHLVVRGPDDEPVGIVSARDLLYAYAR